MISQARYIAGWGAAVCYLMMGALFYLTIIPAVGGLWPPEFYLRGYSDAAMFEFWQALPVQAERTYQTVLLGWDRAFVVMVVLWVALTGWRGGWMRFAVAFLAVLYGAIDWAENFAIHRFISPVEWDPRFVELASSLTRAKFAAAYLCALVLLVHLRRSR